MNESQTRSPWLHAFLAAGAVFLAACDDTKRASYATAAAARSDEAVQRGWLPAELPDSANSISESHDLDTNSGSGSFRFEAVDADSFRAKLQPAPPALVQRFHDSDRLQREGHTFHVVPEFVLAVDWRNRDVRFVLNFKSNE